MKTKEEIDKIFEKWEELAKKDIIKTEDQPKPISIENYGKRHQSIQQPKEQEQKNEKRKRKIGGKSQQKETNRYSI